MLHPNLFCFFSYSAATKCKILWALHVYHDWKNSHNATLMTQGKAGLTTGDLFHMEAEEIVRTLTKFVLEVWKKTGEPYPSDTLYELLISLQMYFQLRG